MKITNCLKTDFITGIVVDQNQALRFAIDIARGMEFLHSLEPGIPNFILTSKHVMVSRFLWTLRILNQTLKCHTRTLLL